MQIMSFLITPLLASGLVSAAPSKTSESVNFEVIALRSASKIHFSPLQAARNNFFLQLPNEKAVCDKKSDNSVTLQLVDGELELYKSSGTRQKVFVDRSGMGQGVLGYTSANSFPKNSERKGWAIDKNGDLTFDGSSLLACPHSISDSWSVWVDVGIANPGGNTDCLGFVARTAKVAKPNSCTYTEQK